MNCPHCKSQQITEQGDHYNCGFCHLSWENRNAPQKPQDTPSLGDIINGRGERIQVSEGVRIENGQIKLPEGEFWIMWPHVEQYGNLIDGEWRRLPHAEMNQEYVPNPDLEKLRSALPWEQPPTVEQLALLLGEPLSPEEAEIALKILRKEMRKEIERQVRAHEAHIYLKAMGEGEDK